MKTPDRINRDDGRGRDSPSKVIHTLFFRKTKGSKELFISDDDSYFTCFIGLGIGTLEKGRSGGGRDKTLIFLRRGVGKNPNYLSSEDNSLTCEVVVEGRDYTTPNVPHVQKIPRVLIISTLPCW